MGIETTGLMLISYIYGLPIGAMRCLWICWYLCTCLAVNWCPDSRGKVNQEILHFIEHDLCRQGSKHGDHRLELLGKSKQLNT